MFKILVLQALYGLSDDQAEFQIQDRLSFMRFLGLGLAERVPDARTIWLFREQLVQAGAMEDLFRRFDESLCKAGYLAMGGQIVDATVVAAPKQRNTDGEKAAIKRGEVPQAWRDKPAKRRQKDRDARWTVKFSKAKPDQDGKWRMRDELLNETPFLGLAHARSLITEWVTDYNEVWPHSSRGYITPAAFAAGLTATGSPLRNPGQLHCEPVAHHASIGVSETKETPVAIG